MRPHRSVIKIFRPLVPMHLDKQFAIEKFARAASPENVLLVHVSIHTSSLFMQDPAQEEEKPTPCSSLRVTSSKMVCE